MYLKIATQGTRIFQNAAKYAPMARPTLSVQHRFAPTKNSTRCLAKNGGERPFLKYVYLGRCMIQEL
jgi:hypothetical protein